MKPIRINNIEWFLDDADMAVPLTEIGPVETGRRGYSILSFRGKRFFLKSFREKGITGFIRGKMAPRGKREYEMGRALKALSIQTPEPVGYGLAAASSYVIQGFIEGRNLLDVFDDGEDRLVLLERLAHLLSLLMLRRVRHNDLHLNNIIVNREGLYLIDLHKMVIKKTFTEGDELSNVSHSLAMIYTRMTEEEKIVFFNAYGNKNIRDRIDREIRRMRMKWITRKRARAFDETSMTKRQGSIIYMKATGAPDDCALVETIKRDKKTEVLRYTDHVRKLYKSRGRLKRAWESSVVLAYMGLHITPEVYYIRMPLFFSKGFIAMEDLKGRGEELDRFLDRHYRDMSVDERRAFISNMAGFFSDFLSMDIIHRDMKGCNIFVRKEKGFLLLDLEDIEFRGIDGERLKRMLIQLNTTIPVYIKNTDRMRFFLMVTEKLKISKKEVARYIARQSLEREIVYEGKDGLITERFKV